VQVTLVSAAHTATLAAPFTFYDPTVLAEQQTSGLLQLTPRWLDISGSDNITVSGSNLFASGDNVKLRATLNAPSRALGRRSLLQLHVHPLESVHMTEATLRGHQVAWSLVTALWTSEVPCTVLSASTATCLSITGSPGGSVSLQLARNGQDFVPLAASVRGATPVLL
jgi:hypothetical protein